MNEHVSNLILEPMRRMEDKVDTVIAETREVRLRVTALKVQIGSTKQRLDRIEGTVERIERRLDFVEG
jgi:hypothetical protein